MPFVVDRRTGKIISAPELTQEQKDFAWEMIVRNWVQRHADELRELCVSTDNAMEKGDNLQAEKLTLSVPEAAKMLGISRARMYQLARSEGFPTIMVGKRILVSKKGLEQWIDEQVRR